VRFANFHRRGLLSHPLSQPASQQFKGFTLIEILVALVIVSVSLMAALGAVGTLTDSAAGLRLRTLALWSAENRLSTIRVEIDREWPALGKRSSDCPQGLLKLRCDEEVFSTPNPFFRRVEVSVYEANTTVPRLAKLTGFATNLPNSAGTGVTAP
jgi:general secretion pathway protein I